MTDEEGDAERWGALPSELDDPASNDSLVGPVVVTGSSYVHPLSRQGQLVISHRPEQGLSFQIWPAAIRLVEHAVSSQAALPGCWKDLKIVELGSGSGLAGLAFAACGGDVLLTDLPKCMDLLKQNITQNETLIAAAGGHAQCCPFIWGTSTLLDLPQAWQQADLIIAADVIYNQELIQPLLAAAHLLVHEEATMLLSHVRRWKSDMHFFHRAAAKFVVGRGSPVVGPGPERPGRGSPMLYTLVKKHSKRAA